MFYVEQETMTLGLNDGDFVKSVNFPTECCEARQYLIQYEGEAPQGYLRMTFDDLDLPKGTILQVLFYLFFFLTKIVANTAYNG